MKVTTSILVVLLVSMTAGPWTTGDVSAQSPRRLSTDTPEGRQRLQEWILERRLAEMLAEPQMSAEAKANLENQLRRVRARQNAPTVERRGDGVVVRDTCALPNGSVYRAGDSVTYRDQQYRCADVYDETLSPTGVSWIKVLPE